MTIQKIMNSLIISIIIIIFIECSLIYLKKKKKIKINLDFFFFEENSLIVFLIYCIFSIFLLKLVSYNIILYYFCFKFCTNILFFFPKNILLNYYFDFFSKEFDLKEYQYSFLYIYSNNDFFKKIINIFMLIICYYYSFFIIVYFVFNFLNLDRKFDNAINGYFDFENQEIELTFKGLIKIKKYKLSLIYGDLDAINDLNLIYNEDFSFKNPIFNKMFINGYI